jgi:hypothetical protein
MLAGPYALDWWDGDPRQGKSDAACSLFLRPATVGNETLVTDPSWGGACTLLNHRGCTLPFDERPTGCRLLDPTVCMTPKCADLKRMAAIEWLPYQDILRAALLLVGGDDCDIYDANVRGTADG